MKSFMIWSVFVFLITVSAFFGVHYFFLSQHGFDARHYLLAFLMLFPAAFIVGYIFIASIYEARESQEKMLEHLVREVLHEINLPLSTIRANAEMILGQSKESRETKRAERILLASDRLHKLYRELAYNIRREYAPVEREEFDLDETVRERVSYFEELGRNPFKLHLLPLRVFADRVGLEQVLDNLLENAMKYSPPDSVIQIGISGSELTINDRGTGMDENEILRIYERYYQSDRKVRGEGIGLAIVKRYCDDEKVGLRIVSRKNRGTQIIMDLSKIMVQQK